MNADTFKYFEEVIPPDILKDLSEGHIAIHRDVLSQVRSYLSDKHFCIVTGREKSGKTWLCYALCYNLKKEKEEQGERPFISFITIDEKCNWNKAWESIESSFKHRRKFEEYFIIEDCDKNVEATNNLLAKIQDNYKENLRFLFTLQKTGELSQIEDGKIFNLGEQRKCVVPLKPSKKHVKNIIENFLETEELSVSEDEIESVAIKWGSEYNLEKVSQYLERWKHGEGQRLSEIEEQIEQEKILEEITPETLRKDEKDAQELLQELEEYKASYGVGSDEYLEYCNAEAFIAHLPEWKHLYMKEYGAFSRPKKENQILSDMERNIQKFARKKNGLLLHLISGDSGCGKSALVKLVLRRLIDKQKLEEFQYLTEILPWIRIFELGEKKDWEALEKAVSMNFQQVVEGNKFLYIVYFEDDLFELEKEERNKLLGIFKRASDNLQIYFLTTSPSWIFNQRDLNEYRKKFGLVASNSTQIGDLDQEDRKALKKQYQAMYGETCRSDLLELIDSEEETLILLKLALHQNLTYSEYLESVFHKLEAKQPEYLAALLLSSTLARFYVHFPISIIQELNRDLPPQDRLPGDSSFYAEINEQGLRLFRIRTGTRSEKNPTGLPDTIAPFHDRVAQVIYNTWPMGEDVPAFGCKLWELKDKVYLKLNESPQTPPILANVFRGHLHREVSDNELSLFVDRFGPVQHNIWTLLDEPDATYRWITYSKYNMGRTKRFRKHWERVLNRMAREDVKKATKAYIALFLLNPHKMSHLEDWGWIQGVPDLDEKYSFTLQAMLDELLSQTPIHVELLTEYLRQMEKWLIKYAPTDRLSISYRYSVIFTLAKRLHIVKIRTEKPLNDALAQIIKNYLININHEYLTNDLLAKIKMGLSTQIDWALSDLKDMSASLFDYVQVEEDKFRPVLFGQFLHFVRSGEIEGFPEERILDLYWKICIQNAGFSGLTYTSRELFEYLIWIKQKNRSLFRQIVTEMFNSLTEGKLNQFMQSTAYPDFLSRFLESLGTIQLEINAEQLLGLLRPLVTNFYDPPPTRFVFGEVKRLKCTDLQLVLHQIKGDTDRQIRLCLAKEINLSLDLALKDFTELLEEGKITIPTSLCDRVTDYLKNKKKSEVSEASLEDYRRRIYAWLRQNDDKSESASVLKLLGTDILFSNDLEGFERIVEHAIQVGRVPFWYLEWWLKEEAARVSTEQRYAVLDAFWGYALRISDEEINGEFRTYNQYFLFLLEKYRIGQDPTWWGHAVQKLLEFYSQSVTRSRFKPRWIRRKGKHLPERRILYKQRVCMDQIMESILRSSSLLDEALRVDFIKRVEEGLKPYENQSWALRWIAHLNPKIEIDGTRRFLDYLSSIEEQPQGIQSDDILNQSNRWFGWVKISKREISTELTKVWRWLDQTHPPTVSIFLIPAFFKICPETLHHFEIANSVKNVLEKVKYDDFKAKEYLISDYLWWLETYAEKEQYTLSEQEVKTLKDILIWFLREVNNRIDTSAAVYGLQHVFQVAFKYKLDFEQAVENIFFKILETQIKHEEGGWLAKHYFTWLFYQNRPVEISKYLQWLGTYYQEAQTPYVLMHLIRSLSKNASTIKPTTDEIEQIWGTLKLLIANRLENEGTTFAAQDFMKLCHQKTLSIDEDKLNEILTDSYQLCLQMSDHERVIYLLINFFPFWQHPLDQSSPGEIVDLWRKVSLAEYKKGESFGKLTRQVNDYLQKRDEKQSFSEFHKELIVFIEANQDHMLSPKFAKLLILAKSYFHELSRLLPDLIKSQNTLEDMAYTLGEYFKWLSEIPEEKRTEYETSIFKVLEMNVHKLYGGFCLRFIMERCTPKVHYNLTTKIIEAYLEKTTNPTGITKMFREYYDYGKRSEIDESTLKKSIERLLLVIRLNNLNIAAPKACSAILNIWNKDQISRESATSTLITLILHRNPTKWESILYCCNHFRKLFGSKILLSQELSIGTVCKQLEIHKEEGFILIKQQLQSKFASDKTETNLQKDK